MPAPTEKPMTPATVVLLLSLLLGMQPVATDLYLPALPMLSRSLQASMAQAQLTLSAMLMGFGLSQLAWGPLSDRFGRRPVLIAGQGLFLLASVGAALAPGIDALIGWRGLQGLALGATMMGARAVIRDLYQPADAARVMSKALGGLGLFACASAPLGGLLAQQLGWRAALAGVALLGAAVLVVLLLRLGETLQRPDPYALQPARLLQNWRLILGHPTFWSQALISAFSFGGLFTFLSCSSFVFIGQMGLSQSGFGLVMLAMSLCYISGTFVCRRLLARLGVRRTIAAAAALSLCGGIGLAIGAWLELNSPWSVALPFALYIMAHGIHQPCAQSGSVAPFPQAAGAASAWSGCLCMVLAFGNGQTLGWLLGKDWLNPHDALGWGVLLWAALLALNAWTAVQRHGEVRPPPRRHA
ncbi:MAG: Bicyclomycin resistance protein [Pseudomonadota bacterium]|jgi:DHA1 family bicyclomycin/chloramphenicol resistance-like MFS transporter